MGNWVRYKPKFKEECLMLTASKHKNEWFYNAWWIREVDGDDGGWYWGLCTIDGEEWGDVNDLSADLYKIINIPSKSIKNKNGNN